MTSRPTALTESAMVGIGARQHGVVARWQLLEAGLSARQIQHRIESRRLTPVHRGVYTIGPVVGELHREMAAVLLCGPRSFVSHWTASAYWRLLPGPTTGPVAISTLRDVRPGDPGVRVHRVSRLDVDEVTSRAGLPLTTPARTLLDLAGCVGPVPLERALARALRKELVGTEDVQRLLDRYRRRPGRRRLRALLDADASPRFTRSEAERAFLELVRSGDLRPPETNVIVHGHEVDCLWRAERLIVEVDGRQYHSDPRSFELDRRRDAVLIAAGYRVMRVTWSQIRAGPRPLLVRLAKALARGQG